jgi:hypothetical protein
MPPMCPGRRKIEDKASRDREQDKVEAIRQGAAQIVQRFVDMSREISARHPPSGLAAKMGAGPNRPRRSSVSSLKKNSLLAGNVRPSATGSVDAPVLSSGLSPSGKKSQVQTRHRIAPMTERRGKAASVKRSKR